MPDQQPDTQDQHQDLPDQRIPVEDLAETEFVTDIDLYPDQLQLVNKINSRDQ